MLRRALFRLVEVCLYKMPIILESHDIFWSKFAYLYILHCLDIGMQNGDEASPSTSMACRGQVSDVCLCLGSQWLNLLFFTKL